jgi:hypothetical protein
MRGSGRVMGRTVASAALLLAACTADAPSRSETRAPPPVAAVAVRAVPDDPFVSPYTNTPYGGSHVIRYTGQPVGTITAVGDVAVLELDEGVVSDANLFDLDGRTLRFTPEGSGFRVETLPLEWSAEGGELLDGSEVELSFVFPFSGREWTSLVVDDMGLITFGGSTTTSDSGGTCTTSSSARPSSTPSRPSSPS